MIGMNFLGLSPKGEDYKTRIEAFMEEYIYPNEKVVSSG